MVQVSGENLSAKLSWLGEWRYCEPYDVIVVNAAASVPFDVQSSAPAAAGPAETRMVQ